MTPITLYSQSDLAKVLGVGPSAITNWKRRGVEHKHLPRPMYQTRGGRALWTADQVRGILAEQSARIADLEAELLD